MPEVFNLPPIDFVPESLRKVLEPPDADYKFCCNGIIILKTVVPEPLILNWIHEETQTSGTLNLDNVNVHPVTWNTFRQLGRYKYFVDVVTTYRDLTGIVTQVAQFCGPFIGFAIRGKPNNQDEPAQTIHTTSWTYATNWDYLRGDNIIIIQIVKPDGTIAYAGVQAGGGRFNIPLKTEILTNTLRAETSGECVEQDACTLLVKDGTGSTLLTKHFANSCPTVSLSGCEYLYAEKTRTNRIRMETTYQPFPMGSIKVEDCFLVSKVEDYGRKGLVFEKLRTITTKQIFTDVLGGMTREVTSVTYEAQLFGKLYSSKGCDYPSFGVTCEEEQSSEEEEFPEESPCPPGTAYTCIRIIDSIRFKCCYDCEGNVIQTIRLGAV